MAARAVNNPTYSVLAGDPRFRAIVGQAECIPGVDASALLREWDRAGYRHLSMILGRLMGAAVVVLRNPGDALDLARELGADAEGDAGE
jgi:hypothetical protein